nr:zf-CCHC domain-containing protein/DUF4219 domain-containing protein/UBN2 domain-containing protein [Tanacetum cinerariifolium]
MVQENYDKGIFMQRPPLLEPNGFCFWKARFETYVKSKDIDLWQVIQNGDFYFEVEDSKTKLMKETPYELLKDEKKKQLGKNNETKMTLYNALPRKKYERVFMCKTAKERAKVAAIEEAKDLATLPLSELIRNLKVYEMVLDDDDGVASKTTKEKVKSLALKAKVTREQTSDDSDSQGGIDEDIDEEEAEAFNLLAMNFRKGGRFRREYQFSNGGNQFGKDRGHFASEYRKPKENKAFSGGAWSDSEDGDEPLNNATCLMAIDSQEVVSKPSISSYDLNIVDLQKENEELLRFNKHFAQTYEKLLNEKRSLECKNSKLLSHINDLGFEVKKLVNDKEVVEPCQKGRKNNHRKKVDIVLCSSSVTGLDRIMTDAISLVDVAATKEVFSSPIVDENVVKEKTSSCEETTGLESYPQLPTQHPDENLLKEDVSTILVWVKIHGVPVTDFSEEGFGAIDTKLGAGETKTIKKPSQTFRGVSVGLKVGNLIKNIDLFPKSLMLALAVCLKCDLLLDDLIVDSGYTKNMTENRRLFTLYKVYDGGYVVFGNNLKGEVVSGDVKSKTTEDFISNRSFMEVLVLNHYVLVKNVFEEGFGAIDTKLGTPLMLDSYTSDMCMQSWGWSSYDRAMIKLRAFVELKDNIIGEPHKEYRPVPKKPNARSSGNKKKRVEPTIKVSNSNPLDVLNSVDNDVELGTNRGLQIWKFKDLLTSGQAILMDEACNPLKKVEFLGDYQTEDEVASVDNDMACSLASERVCLKCDLLLDDLIVDSGYTKNMTENRRLFTLYKVYDGGYVVFGNNLKGEVVSGGNITHDFISITNVEHVSGLAINLIRIDQLYNDDCIVSFTKVDYTISKNGKTLAKGHRIKGMVYILEN